MKRTIILIAALAFCATSFAQNEYDALRYSTNNYYGTARSIAVGNAMTAVGGDLGAIGLNPAGSAVSGYSQFTLTPNVSLVATQATYDAVPGKTGSVLSTRDSWSRFSMPNFGMVFNFDLHRRSGIRNISLGFIGNATSNFLDRMAAEGDNSATSFLGQLAAATTGIPTSQLESYNSSAPWNSVIGYNTDMISAYGSGDTDYIGATEKLYGDEITLAGPLSQRYGRQSSGNKYDLLFNAGMNISDVLYIGANLGLVSIDYSTNTYFKEAALDPNQFGIEYADGFVSYFDNMRYRQHIDATGSGIYGKLGFIVRPVGGLRIGAAFQTPTSNFITEHWVYSGDITFSDRSNSETSPEGSFEYRLTSPWRFNAGVAYTFGAMGFLSADYEMCDYSRMRFREVGTNDDSEFSYENSNILNYMGMSHMLRLGAEMKVVPEVALRAGYNLTTTPERYLDTVGNKIAPSASRHAISFGFGYSSKGSFFADFACRGNFLPKEYIYPYDNYIDGTDSPEIMNKMQLWDIVATFGWRF